MRVCHVTYVRTTNYGSCFQAYALDETLKAMGHSSYLREAGDLSGVKPRSLKGRVKRLVKGIIKEKIQRPGFRSFEEQHCQYTRKLKSMEEYDILGKEYDVYITGSDVVWNTSFNLKKEIYYLHFTKKYKFSYAASFGKGKLSEDDERLASRYLPELDAISVREKSSAENAARFTDKPVEVVVDPVLLLEKEAWTALAKPVSDQPFIILYATDYIKSQERFVKKLQKKTGLKVVRVSWKTKEMLLQGRFHYPSPEEWLGLLNGAEYIVTNSFHATAFSTFFHKNFYSFVPKDGKQGIGSRLYDFLEQFGLENRIYTDCPAEIDTTAPDFTLADEKIPLLRERSMDFLRRNLEAAEKRLKESEIKQ